jgi:signal transduction histidine kinase
MTALNGAGETAAQEQQVKNARLASDTCGTVTVDEAGKAIRGFATAQDVTDQHRNEERLARSYEQLRALAARQESILEAERTRIAREIHDQLGQSLTALKMDLVWLGVRLPPEAAEELGQKMAAMSQLIDSSIQTVREIATDLRPAMLDDLGLPPAIEAQTQRFEERTGISCAFTTPMDDLALGEPQATAVFRVVQEALTNVARHAGATHVDVRLQWQDGNLLVEITDDGRGITEAEITGLPSLGLLGMRERVHLIGGDIRFEGYANGSHVTGSHATIRQGTTVTIRIPLPHGEV